jgi:predicted HAD superfamily Cof-like phosphohydrolase
MSNFDKVLEFNKAFEIKINTSPKKNLYDEDPNLVKYRLSLIQEEVTELQESLTKKDLNETIDALTDILYVVYGAYSDFGVDADKVFDIVHKSNMSKLCSSEEEAIQTVNYYKTEFSDRYDSPLYRKKKDNENDKEYWIVYNKSTNKILKSINYKAVNFNL